MSDSTVISVVPLLIFGAGGVAAAMLFLALRREAGEMRHRIASLESAANDAFTMVQSRVDELGERIRLAEERPAHASEPFRAGLNLNNRAQALRMLRRGVDAKSIAASLNLPGPDIELLSPRSAIVGGFRRRYF